MEENPNSPTTALGEESNKVYHLNADQFKQARHTAKLLTKRAKHERSLAKKREERWSQPYSDAKIEDVRSVWDYTQSVEYRLELLFKILSDKGMVTADEVKQADEYQKKRLEVFKRLTTDLEISEEQKRVTAALWEIPVNLLGLTVEEEPVTTGDESNISEVVG